jgi:hypothetical protein
MTKQTQSKDQANAQKQNPIYKQTSVFVLYFSMFLFWQKSFISKVIVNLYTISACYAWALDT